ncbi:unnamed protein product [Thlaspi arvense]|uniref:Secreted protein n=1 Tax=Thlaspi arvense TaxID=13288 RepID=A0AAU9T4S7_THLAR|nr:unnamed protein product [Thlaspi arvense]
MVVEINVLFLSILYLIFIRNGAMFSASCLAYVFKTFCIWAKSEVCLGSLQLIRNKTAAIKGIMTSKEPEAVAV